MIQVQAEDAAGTDIVVPFDSRKRKRAFAAQKVQHLIPAVGLLFSGVQSLMSGAEGVELVLAVGGMVTSVLLLTAVGRHVKNRRKPAHAHGAHGIDWMDIWAAGVLFAEAAEKIRTRGHYFRPETLAATATLGLGLFHGRLAAGAARRRTLRVTQDHLYVAGRLRFSRALTAPWADIAQITIDDRFAVVRLRSGRSRRIDFRDLENAPAVREALLVAQRRLPPAPSMTAAQDAP
jgi:hypothetical protein